MPAVISKLQQNLTNALPVLETNVVYCCFSVERASVPSCVQSGSCSQRLGQGQGREQLRFPGHGVCGGGGQHLLHHRALCRQQVRHPRAEDRRKLQVFHVSILHIVFLFFFFLMTALRNTFAMAGYELYYPKNKTNFFINNLRFGVE